MIEVTYALVSAIGGTPPAACAPSGTGVIRGQRLFDVSIELVQQLPKVASTAYEILSWSVGIHAKPRAVPGITVPSDGPFGR